MPDGNTPVLTTPDANDQTTKSRANRLSIPKAAERGPKLEIGGRIQAAVRAIEAHQPLMDAAYERHAAAEKARHDLRERIGEPQPMFNGAPVARKISEPYPPEYEAALDAEAATDEAWQASYHHRDDLVHQLLAVPAAAPHEALFKLKAAACAMECKLGDVEDERWAQAFLDAAVRDLGRFAKIDQPYAPPTDLEAAWEAVVLAYEAVRSNYEERSRRSMAAFLAHRHAMPEVLRSRSLHQRIIPRWQSVKALDADILLTPDAKAELRPQLEAWLAGPGAAAHERQTAEEREAENRDDEEMEALHDDVTDAETAVMDTQCPDVHALLYKQRLQAREMDDDKFGLADLGLVAVAKHGYWKERSRIWQYIDTLRIAGVDDPVLHMPDFSPRGWTKAFEGLGGKVTVQGDELIIILATDHDADADGRSSALLAELEATPWKYRALQLFATERSAQGADPIFSAYRELRPTKERRPLPPARALRITFATVRGEPRPFVEPICNGKRWDRVA